MPLAEHLECGKHQTMSQFPSSTPILTVDSKILSGFSLPLEIIHILTASCFTPAPPQSLTPFLAGGFWF